MADKTEYELYKLNESGDNVKTKLSVIRIASDGSNAVTIANLRLNETALSTAITDNTLSGAKIKANTIDGTKLIGGTVGKDQIGSGAIQSGHLDAGCVGTNAIAAGAVTSGKIGEDAVTNFHLDEDSVDTLQIKDGAVTMGKIAGTIPADKLAGGITNAQLAGGIEPEKLNTIPSTKLDKHSIFINGEIIELGGSKSGLSTATNITNGRGDYSIAQGLSTTAAVGKYSAAFGIGTNATKDYQAVFGQYNADSDNALLIVGNGVAGAGKNIFEVVTDGGYSKQYTNCSGIKIVDSDNNNNIIISGGTYSSSVSSLYVNEHSIPMLSVDNWTKDIGGIHLETPGAYIALPEIRATGMIKACGDSVELGNGYITINSNSADDTNKLIFKSTSGNIVTLSAAEALSVGGCTINLPSAAGTLITQEAVKTMLNNKNLVTYTLDYVNNILTLKKVSF